MRRRSLVRSRAGGALSEQAMSYLDFPIPESLVHAEVFGARVHFGQSVTTAKLPNRIAVLTARKELDAFLLEKAAEVGTQIVQGSRVRHVEQHPDFVQVTTNSRSFTSRYVAGADGAQSSVAIHVRPKFSKQRSMLTFEFDVPCAAPLPPVIADGCIDIHFGKEYNGYSWVFAKRSYWNVGVGALASQSANVKAAAFKFLESLDQIPRDPAASPQNAVGWIVPAGGYKRSLAKGRILLVGDAAGFVDPFYGEGIAYAVRSGAIAGTIAGCAAREGILPRFARRQYSAECRKHIESNLRYGLLFARALHAWPNGLLRLFSSEPSLLRRYLEVPAADLAYKEYVRWFLPRAVAALLRDVAKRIGGNL